MTSISFWCVYDIWYYVINKNAILNEINGRKNSGKFCLATLHFISLQYNSFVITNDYTQNIKLLEEIEMKNLEMMEAKLERKHERQMKAFKEMAFFLELEKMEYQVSGYRNGSLYVDANDDVTFKIWIENGQYVLETEFYRSGLVDGDGYYIGFVFLDKIKRVGAKTIVNNMIRICNNIDDLVIAKLEQKEKWKRQREENAERYKQKIREEVIAELQKEQEAVKKAPAKKRARKAVKKTENTEKTTTLPPVPPAPMIDIAHEDTPDF